MNIILHLCFKQSFEFTKIHEDVHEFIATLEFQLLIIKKFSILIELNALLSALSYILLFKHYVLSQTMNVNELDKILEVCSFKKNINCDSINSSRFFKK